jgi:F0F1-type ATP synthase membrane subunit b/b'
MSKETFFKIRETETEAERIIAEAEAEAKRMIAEAKAVGEALCREAERETSEELARMMEQIRQRGDEHVERVLEEGRELAAETEDQIRLTRRSAEKIVLRGLEAKCR